MIEILDWFAVSGWRVIALFGFMVFFLDGLATIAKALRK